MSLSAVRGLPYEAVSKDVYSDGAVRENLIGGYKRRGKRECWESIKMQGVQDFEFLESRQVLDIDKERGFRD